MAKLLKNLGYYNGKYDTIDKISIPMTDRVCFFGDGVYEATPARNGIIYCLDEHIERFFNSAKLVEIDIPHSKDELKAILTDMLSKVDTSATGGEALVYWQLTRGAEVPRNHCFPQNCPARLWITVTPRPLPDVYRKASMISHEDIRFFMCNVKTLCLLPNVLASEKASRAGAEECVQYRAEANGIKNRVTEGAHSNVHCIKDGAFYTAPLDNLILPGISRRNIINACKKLGIPVREEPYSLSFLRSADEIIFSSSSNPCVVATKLDGEAVGGKAPELLKRLQDALLEDYLTKTEKN